MNDDPRHEEYAKKLISVFGKQAYTKFMKGAKEYPVPLWEIYPKKSFDHAYEEVIDLMHFMTDLKLKLDSGEWQIIKVATNEPIDLAEIIAESPLSPNEA